MSSLQYFLQLFIICSIFNGIISTERSLENNLIEKDLESLINSRKEVLRIGVWNPEVLRAYQLRRIQHAAENTISLDVPILQLSKDTNRSECSKELEHTLVSLKEQWAEEMIDAFGKPSSGILRGQISWPGNFDECVQVFSPRSSWTASFTGRYAWLVFTFLPKNNISSPVSINVGACLPSSCADDQTISQDYNDFILWLAQFSFLKKFVASLPLLSVIFLPADYPLSGASIACIVVCGVFGILVMVGTAVDSLRRYKKRRPPKENGLLPNEAHPTGDDAQLDNSINDYSPDTAEILIVNNRDPKLVVADFLICFSAISNAESILDTSSGQGQLQCIHGIRFLSMAWVILGHTYYFGLTSFENLLDLVDLVNAWPIQVVMQGTYSVDTFFLLSGCLLAYLYFKNQHQVTGIKEWILFYVHRYVRLTPVYAMLLFVLATWYNSLGTGPYWNLFNRDTCEKSWWWNIIYINNFLEPLKMCMGWAWYLAVDMQFFIVCPLFLLPFKRNRITGFTVILLFLVASWTATGVISRVYHLEEIYDANLTSLDAMQKQQEDLFNYVYVKPHTRIGPYLIGVLLGYALYEVRGRQKFLHKYVIIICWIVSQVLSLTILYGMKNAHLGPITASAHFALARSAWAITVSWVIFACLTGHAGPVNTLLSWKAWIPLSRLTYCAYLVHPMVMSWYFATLRSTLHFSTSLIVILYLSFMVLSYGLAFVASLMFEAPIMKLEKFLRKL